MSKSGMDTTASYCSFTSGEIHASHVIAVFTSNNRVLTLLNLGVWDHTRLGVTLLARQCEFFSVSLYLSHQLGTDGVG